MNSDQPTSDQDCAVCLQKCHHPTQLPCGHVFCFLCVKGVAIQSKKCAMCRADIPLNYLDHPVLLEKLTPEQSSEHSNDYQWYYEGRNGWWKYDERSNAELERAYIAEESNCSLLLAGALYSINFQSMVQFRRTDPTRRRKIRRDVPNLPAKGIAGIKISSDENKEEENHQQNNEINEDSPIEVNSVSVLEQEQVDNLENTSSETNNLSGILERLSSINLDGNQSSSSTRSEEEI